MNEIAEAAAVIHQGDLVVYPTDTLYGLGSSIINEEAVEQVYRLKRRPASIPLPVAVSSIDDIAKVAYMNETAQALAEALLPGALTLVLPRREEVTAQVAGDTIAVRVPGHKIALQLCREAGPITATSANIHGGEAPTTVAEARRQLGDDVERYLDGGRLPGVASTVVDVTSKAMIIIRHGAIPEERLHDITY
jgi:L-threonylcarbamoyladenylate synthase